MIVFSLPAVGPPCRRRPIQYTGAANRCRSAAMTIHGSPFAYSAALIGSLLISTFWVSALGLFRGGRLSLHLPLGIFRRGSNLSAGAVHGTCRRMLLAVIADSHRLAGALRCRSGPCILQVCGAAGGVTWASQAVPALRTTTEQPVRINCLIAICVSLFPPEAPGVPVLRATDAEVAGSEWRREF